MALPDYLYRNAVILEESNSEVGNLFQLYSNSKTLTEELEPVEAESHPS